MKPLLFAIGAFFWAILVFVVTLFVTFPSQTLADRIRYEIPLRLGDEYSGEVGSVRPWWMGLSVNDVKIYQAAGSPPRGEDGELVADAAPQLVALLGNLRMRVSTWSLLRRAPYVSGSVTLTEGRVTYAIGTAVDPRGSEIALSDLVLGANALPLADLFVLMPDVSATGTGNVDLDIDLHAGENGMRDATGHISFGGTNLVLSDIEIPNMGALGMDVPISELALAADVVDGVATITSGKLLSDIATVEITGTITFRDPIDRSAVDIDIALSNLGEVLAPYKGFLGDGGTEGVYHYSCRGVLSRMGASSCSPGSRERRVSSRPVPGSPSSTPLPRSSAPGNAREAETDEERERRRDEIRERLRQKREEREAERNGTAPPTPPGREEVGEDEEPEPEEEPIEEEELPPDEDPELEEPLE